MPITRFVESTDPRLEPFRKIRQRSWIEGSGIFVAEGPQLVQALLASSFETHSVLVDEKVAERFLPILPPELDTFVVPHELVSSVTGFDFHRGILACGRRSPIPDVKSLESKVENTYIGLWGLEDQQNMGTILRTAAGLGIDGVIVGPKCCDPFSRRCLRVSMGNTLQMPLYSCRIQGDLFSWIQGNKLSSVATSLRADAVSLQQVNFDRLRSDSNRGILVWFGNEYSGLPESMLEACQMEIGVKMRRGTDSLNVSVAAGIIMHHVVSNQRTEM